MRLIVSVDALRPPLTGIGRYTWELVSRLQRSSSEFRQLRFFRNGRWVADPASLLDQLPAVVAPTAAAARPVPPWTRWSRALYWDTTCRFNVFHSPNYFLPPFARNGVATLHDLSVFRFPQTHPVERVRQFERSFDKTLAIASRLITDSEAVRQEVIAEFGWPADRIDAIALGVAPDYAPREATQTQPVLAPLGLEHDGFTLCVSTIEPRKRIGALLAAYRHLPAPVRRRWPLVLVGAAGWHSEEIFEQIDAGRREGWLHYLGFVPAADMPTIYAGARLFVYPSIYEGFGLPVAEAMASGVPTVTSDRSCLPEVAGGAARLVDPDDTVSFASAVEIALTDDGWRRGAIAAGLAVAAGYSWDRCVESTVAVYRAANA